MAEKSLANKRFRKKQNQYFGAMLFVIFVLLLTLPVRLTAISSKTDTLIVFPGDSLLQLSNQCVLPSSLDFQFISNDTLHFDSLQVDALRGKIYGFNTPVDTVLTFVTYQFITLNVPRQNIINPPPRIFLNGKAETDEKKRLAITKEIQTSVDYDFLKSGTIYRGISMGSESGFALQSGLNLELEGKLSDDISIIGALTDKNIPIQPEGNTQTLNEIDKVFIKVGMPNESITFGDYEISMPEGVLGGYHRKLQGVYGVSNRNSTKSILGGAVSKGQYHSNIFNGEEGNQGPYQLTGEEGEMAIIVLAGTEKIWIDGEALIRGENNDYIIDYSVGTITFTPNRLITSDSRITVDFQYSNLVYQRNIWFAKNTSYWLDDKMKFSAEIINEADDRENPIELALNQNDMDNLGRIGDNKNAAFQSTIIEDSAGVYIFVDSVLIFVGAGMGNYSAVFYNVGEQGEYRKIYDADQIYFQHVDKNDPDIPPDDVEQAVYLPVRPLKLPQQQRLYHFNGQWSPGKNFSVKSEYARSVFDQNTFSKMNDADNQGNAVNFETQWRMPESGFGELAVSGKFRKEDELFQPIDRNREVEYWRKWDVDSDSVNGQQVYETAVNYNLKNTFSCNVEGGSFQRGGINSERYKIQGNFRYKWLENCSVSQEKINKSGTSGLSRNWIRRKGLLSFDIFQTRPYTKLNYERRNGDIEGDNNFQFLEQTYGIESSKNSKFHWRFERHLRQDDGLLDQQWLKEAYARNFIFSGKIIRWKTLSSEWQYTHRQKEYFGDNSQPDLDFYLLYMMVRQDPKKMPFSWEANMKVEEERTVKKEMRYFFVGEGEGQYLYDSTYADYFPHPQGDYILRIMPSNIKEPVTSIQNGFRFRFNGNRIKNKILKNLTTLTDFRLKQQMKQNHDLVNKLIFSPKSIDESWIYFNRVIQQDINYRLSSISGIIRFRFRNSNQTSQLDVRGKEMNIMDQYILNYKGPLIGEIKLDSDLSVKNLERESKFNSLRNRDIFTLKGKNRFSYLLDRLNKVELEIVLNHDVQKGEEEQTAFLTTTKGEFERKIQRKGRWGFFAEVANVKVSPKGSSIPWEMANGKREGITFGWGLSGEYKIGGNFSIRLNYEAWNEPDRELYHLGGGEIRAMF